MVFTHRDQLSTSPLRPTSPLGVKLKNVLGQRVKSGFFTFIRVPAVDHRSASLRPRKGLRLGIRFKTMGWIIAQTVFSKIYI
jgi:hypothetical protein